MLIKLAIYSDKKQEKNIKACCEQYRSSFIPLIENKFGILTKYQYKRLYGKESEDSECNFNIDAFVNIYNCAHDKELNKTSILNIFRKAHRTPYVGMLLDNQFFLNILLFCETNPVKFNFMYIRFDYGDSDSVYDFEKIKSLFSINPPDFKALKLSLSLENNDIIFDEDGYIDIASEEVFFNKHRKLILDMIIFGLREHVHGESH